MKLDLLTTHGGHIKPQHIAGGRATTWTWDEWLQLFGEEHWRCPSCGAWAVVANVAGPDGLVCPCGERWRSA